MWNHLTNMDSMITNFEEELEEQNKTSPSEGSWELNYKGLCDKLNTTGCPFFVLSNSTLRVQNCILDLSSWRCMLLAIPASVPNVTEISLHNCKLSPQHIIDLISTLIQSEKGPRTLRLEFLYFDNENERSESLRALDPLFDSDVKLEYLSLRGNFLSDEMIIRNTGSLRSNVNLKVLDLSCNDMSDVGANALLRSLRINMYLKELSIAKNKICGQFSLETFHNLLVGSPYNPEDDSVMRIMTKLLTEVNRKIKDSNKKRKKNGLSDIPDVAVPKRDPSQKINGQNLISNRSLVALDLSNNPLSFDSVLFYLDSLRNKVGSSGLVTAFGPCSVSLLLNSSASLGTSQMIPLSMIEDLAALGVAVQV